MKGAKIKTKIFLLLLIVFLGVFSVAAKPARALTAVDAFYLITYDTTPLLAGTTDEADSSVTVTIEGHVYTADIDGTDWTVQIDDTMDYGTYDLELSATKGATTVTDTLSGGLIIDDDFPLNVYSASSLVGEITTVTFVTGQTFSLNGITLTIPNDTTISRTGGGNYNLSEMIGDAVSTSNELIAKEIRFGIPNVDLTFSHSLTLAVDVGSSYNGQQLNVFSKSDGGDDGWEPMEIECTVSGGICTFETSHASYFAMSLYHSIAEGEDGDEDDEDENDEPDIDKIEVKKYFNLASGKWKVELIIRGDEYDGDTEVTLGNREAYYTKCKNEHKIVARFSLDKLERSGRDELTIRVKNEDEVKKFKRKFKLSSLTKDFQKI